MFTRSIVSLEMLETSLLPLFAVDRLVLVEEELDSESDYDDEELESELEFSDEEEVDSDSSFLTPIIFSPCSFLVLGMFSDEPELDSESDDDHEELESELESCDEEDVEVKPEGE